VWERERLLNKFILVHSTLSYIQFPDNHWVPLVTQSHITIHTTTKRWSWYHRNHSPSCQTYTFSQNTLWLTRFPHTSQVYKRKKIQESWKEQITLEFTKISELLRSDFEPVHNYSTILQNFSQKEISISLYLILILLFFALKGKPYL